MNEIKTAQAVFFSPTGTTRRVIDAVEGNIGLTELNSIDLTPHKNRSNWKGYTKGDLLLVGVPTYYDTIPSILLGPLNMLQGGGRWAVPITVYGNVSAGDCLGELCGLLHSRGFKILAAASFVAEHSFTTSEVPLAAGRPDGEDLSKAVIFGKRIREKIETGLTEAPVEGIPLKIGSDYMRRPEEYPENGVRDIARVSVHDAEKCNRCNRCAEACPTEAVDADSLEIRDEACIRCFACTRACPTGAIRPFLGKDIVEYFGTLLDKRQEPKIFL